MSWRPKESLDKGSGGFGSLYKDNRKNVLQSSANYKCQKCLQVLQLLFQGYCLEKSPLPQPLTNNHFPSACFESNCIFIEMEKTADLYETSGSFLGTQFLTGEILCSSFHPPPSSEINEFPPDHWLASRILLVILLVSHRSPHLCVNESIIYLSRSGILPTSAPGRENIPRGVAEQNYLNGN